MKSEENIKKIGETIALQRQNQGMQLVELAEKAGVSRQTLGKIESGTANPTVDTLWKIADCLDIPFASLIAEESDVSIKKAEELMEIRSQNGSFSAAPLFTSGKAVVFDTYIGTLEPNTEYKSTPHRDGVAEFLTIIDGELEVILENKSYHLNKQDSIRFRGDKPHVYRNPSDKIAYIYFVVYYV